MAKGKSEVVSLYTHNHEATMTLRVCIAKKDDKAYFNQLSTSDKSKLFRNLENEVTEILGIYDEWYRLNDVYIDYGSWYVTCTFSTKELLPKEMEYIHNISNDIVDVVRGKKVSLN